MKELLEKSGLELAGLIKSGKISSVDVVQTHIDWIKKVNPALNAMVVHRFEAALNEAKKADRVINEGSREELPVYHGVPCSIKESFALEGMPNTSGLPARKGLRAEKNATVVERYLKAGAIPLGVTNISELCMWMESDNRVYGRSNNPYDKRRIVGGSSGGEGAIIGAGGVPFGLGSDIGGSIRMPAFFNGIFGHKPSGGLVPGTGQFPIAQNEALRYLSTGPMTRRAEDLMPLLRIMAGPDGFDEGCEEMVLRDTASVSLKDLTIIDIPDNGLLRVAPELQQAQVMVKQALANEGAIVKTVRISKLKHSFDIWSAMLSSAGGTPFGVLLGNGQDIAVARELLAWTMRTSAHTLPAIALSGLEKLFKSTSKRVQKMVAMGHELREELTETIGKDGVFLYPPYPTVVPYHYQPVLKPYKWMYTAILNVMQFPVTQVPLGLNRKKLPIGIQVGAIRGNDHLTISIAKKLETLFGGWTPPWKV